MEYVIDAGNSTSRSLNLIPLNKIVKRANLLISHLHKDHAGDIHTILKANC